MIRTLAVGMLVTFAMIGCRSIKPYEKEYLLQPIMDDAEVNRLEGPYAKSTRPKERLANAAGVSSASACPTCGGH